MQTGDSIDQAKSSKRMQCLRACAANLINALKLLANQQEDGDGLVHNIVQALVRGAEMVSRTACGTSSGWTVIVPWMLESYTEAREL